MLKPTGDERIALRDEMAKLYIQDKMSVRDISRQTGASYGLVYNLLKEGNVVLRQRGGNTRKRKAA